MDGIKKPTEYFGENITLKHSLCFDKTSNGFKRGRTSKAMEKVCATLKSKYKLYKTNALHEFKKKDALKQIKDNKKMVVKTSVVPRTSVVKTSVVPRTSVVKTSVILKKKELKTVQNRPKVAKDKKGLKKTGGSDITKPSILNALEAYLPKKTCEKRKKKCMLYKDLSRVDPEVYGCTYKYPPTDSYIKSKAKCMGESIIDLDGELDGGNPFIKSLVEKFFEDSLHKKEKEKEKDSLHIGNDVDLKELKNIIVKRVDDYYRNILNNKEYAMNYDGLEGDDKKQQKTKQILELFVEVMNSVKEIGIYGDNIDYYIRNPLELTETPGYHAGYFIYLTLFAKSITHLDLSYFNFYQYAYNSGLSDYMVEEMSAAGYGDLIWNIFNPKPENDKTDIVFKASKFEKLKILHFNCRFSQDDIDIRGSNLEYLDISNSSKLFSPPVVEDGDSSDDDEFQPEFQSEIHKFFCSDDDEIQEGATIASASGLENLKVLIICNSFDSSDGNYFLNSIAKLTSMMGLMINEPNSYLKNLEYVVFSGLEFKEFTRGGGDSIFDMTDKEKYSIYDITKDNFMVPAHEHRYGFKYFHTKPDDEQKEKLNTLTKILKPVELMSTILMSTKRFSLEKQRYLIHIHKNKSNSKQQGGKKKPISNLKKKP